MWCLLCIFFSYKGLVSELLVEIQAGQDQLKKVVVEVLRHKDVTLQYLLIKNMSLRCHETSKRASTHLFSTKMWTPQCKNLTERLRTMNLGKPFFQVWNNPDWLEWNQLYSYIEKSIKSYNHVLYKF